MEWSPAPASVCRVVIGGLCCRDVGADETIIYARDMADAKTQKEFSNHIRAAAGGDGVNVVYDAVGGDYAEPALRTLAWKGRYLVVGFPAGIPKIPLPSRSGRAVGSGAGTNSWSGLTAP